MQGEDQPIRRKLSYGFSMTGKRSPEISMVDAEILKKIVF